MIFGDYCMNVLITGITGFAGSYLAKELLQQFGTDVALFGTGHHKPLPEDLQGKVTLFSGNLEEEVFAQKVLEESEPEWIFHLAAIASGKDSFSAAEKTITSNLQMQLHLFTAVQKLQITPKFLIVGSGEEYGLVSEEANPINEKHSLQPVSPYGFSKLAQDLAAYTYYKSFGLEIVRVRPFNHTGPGQSPTFVIPAFAKQIAAIEKAEQEPIIKVGNLAAVRDFTDVRDMVKAYVLAIQKGEVGDVYNLGSGKGYTISKLLELLIKFSQKEISVAVEKERLRPIDLPVTICNNNKFKTITQWEPLIPIEQTLQDILNYWRKNA